jgi:hypothetical protein
MLPYHCRFVKKPGAEKRHYIKIFCPFPSKLILRYPAKLPEVTRQKKMFDGRKKAMATVSRPEIKLALR